MGAIYLNAESFEQEILTSNQPILVDFFAEWCGPCKMLSPIVDQIADELSGKVKVCKLNVDEAQEIAARYNVMSIPNLILFKNGEVLDQMVGVMPKEQLLQKISAKI
ncbi:MAG TPA: thioredoxin [Candidatus Bathyarchaeia archaeon]|nr:thioredoxin [Candidatus Bathyarchaeia archaeon]